MTDELKPDEVDALIRALDPVECGYVYASTPPPEVTAKWLPLSVAGIVEIDRTEGIYLTHAGTLLAQSLKREREAKADAWDEGYRADAVYVNGPEDAAPPSNPYRKTER